MSLLHCRRCDCLPAHVALVAVVVVANDNDDDRYGDDDAGEDEDNDCGSDSDDCDERMMITLSVRMMKIKTIRL